MFRKLILCFSVLLLQGCLEEPTDEGCIDKLSDVEGNYFTSCLSKDRSIKYNSVLDYRMDGDREVFIENDYITKEEALRKNAFQQKHFEEDEQRLTVKSIIFDSLFSVELLVFLMLFGFSVYAFEQKYQNQGQSKMPMVVAFFIFVLLTSSLFGKTTTSDYIQKNVARATIFVQNGIMRIYVKALYSPGEISKARLTSSSFIEAYNFTSDLTKINICMSNNQKNDIMIKELNEDKNTFNSEKDLASYFDKKNQVVLSTMSNNDFKKISANYIEKGNYLTLHSLVFKDCGNISFKTKTHSSSIVKAMEQVGFNAAIASSIKNKEPKSGWDKIHNAFYNFYAENEESRDLLAELLIAYSYEYKKAMFVGYSKISPLNNKNYAYNSDILKSHLKKSDGVYQLVNNSQCLKNGEIVKRTKDRFKDYKETKTMLNYDCVDITEDGFSPIDVEVLNIKDNKVVIDDLVIENQIKSKALIQKSISDLEADLEAISDFYIVAVDEVYDPHKNVVEYVNEGILSLTKILDISNSSNNEYSHMFKELVNIVNVDYTSSLPNFTNVDTSKEENIELYKVNDVLSHLQNNIESNVHEYFNNSIASSLLEARHNTSRLKSASDGNEIDSSILQRINYFAQQTSQMTCFEEKDCLRKTFNGNAVDSYKNLTEISRKEGANLIINGYVMSFGSEIVKNLADYKIGKNKKKKNSKNNFGKSKYGGKALNATSSVASMTSILASLMITVGTILVFISAIMELVYNLFSYILLFTFNYISIILSLIDYLITAILVLSILSYFRISDYTKSFLQILEIMLAPIRVSIYGIMSVIFIHYITLLFIKLFGYMSLMVNPISSAVPANLQGAASVFLFAMTLMIMIAALFLTVKKRNENRRIIQHFWNV